MTILTEKELKAKAARDLLLPGVWELAQKSRHKNSAFDINITSDDGIIVTRYDKDTNRAFSPHVVFTAEEIADGVHEMEFSSRTKTLFE